MLKNNLSPITKMRICQIKIEAHLHYILQSIKSINQAVSDQLSPQGPILLKIAGKGL